MTLFRTFWLGLAAMLCAGPALAFCDGRYAAAQDLLSRAYEGYATLYSGATHTESLGPTLEIYRLLNGLPAAGLDQPPPDDFEYIDPPSHWQDPVFVEETLSRVLPRLRDPGFRALVGQRYSDTDLLMNNLTSIGPYPGWWLTPDAPHLTEIERVIARYGRDDALDWVLTVQVASAMPHAISWHLNGYADGRRDAANALWSHAVVRYAETQSLAWLVAAAHFREGRHWDLTGTQIDQRDAMAARAASLRAQVLDCSADAAGYVVTVITEFEALRTLSSSYRFELHSVDHWPQVLRRIAATQLAKVLVARSPRYYWTPPFEPADLRAIANDPVFDGWLAAGLSYRARDLSELIALNDGVPLHRDTVLLLNVLSAQDLLDFAASRSAFPDEQRGLVTAAFLRLIALDRDAEAATLVPQLITLWPDEAEPLQQVWSQNRPQAYRLVKVALLLHDTSLRTSVISTEPSENAYWRDWQQRRRADWRENPVWRETPDLPLHFRTGGVLTQRFGRWLMHAGVGWGPEYRAYRRGLAVPDPFAMAGPLFPERSSFVPGDAGPARFGAWQELSRLGPETGLANRVGRVLIDNARQQVDGPLRGVFADKEAVARDLEIVIRQARYVITGETEGQPLGQVAFRLLHRRLGETEAAARTPYWYICRERCVP